MLSADCWSLGAEKPGEKAPSRGHGRHGTLLLALALLLISGERAHRPVHGPFLTGAEEAAEVSPGGPGRAGGAQAGGQGCSGDWQSLLGWPGHHHAVPAFPSSTALRGRSRSHPALNQGMRNTKRFWTVFLTWSRTVLQELVRAITWGEKSTIFQAMGSNIHETLIFNTEPLECRSKQLREEAKAKGRNRAAGEETELTEWEWCRQAGTLWSPVDVTKQAQCPEQRGGLSHSGLSSS